MQTHLSCGRLSQSSAAGLVFSRFLDQIWFCINHLRTPAYLAPSKPECHGVCLAVSLSHSFWDSFSQPLLSFAVCPAVCGACHVVVGRVGCHWAGVRTPKRSLRWVPCVIRLIIEPEWSWWRNISAFQYI